jgi:hypothetical protein
VSVDLDEIRARAEADFDADYDWRLWKGKLASDTHPRVSNDELLDFIRQAAAQLGEPLTAKDYSTLAASRGWPSHQTVFLRFDRWAVACRAAGVGVARANGAHRVDRFSTESCLAAVRALANEIGWIPTYKQYERWARTTTWAPGGCTVRKRLGSWRNVITALRGDPLGYEAARAALAAQETET